MLGSKFNLFLSADDVSRLSALAYRILASRSDSIRVDLCLRACQTLRNDVFPFVFAAALLLRRKRISSAIPLLKIARQDTFARSLLDYYLNINNYSTLPDLFESTEPFEAWTKSSLNKSEMRHTVEMFTRFALKNRYLNGSQILTVLDVGTGNGVLLSLIINRLARQHHFTKANIFLIDSSAVMLMKAKVNCRDLISLPCKISVYHGAVESLNRHAIDDLRANHPAFAITAGCLHHLPRRSKQRAFGILAKIVPELYLEELEANHETPKIDSPELIWSVYQFYNALLRSINGAPIPSNKKSLCSDCFLVPEAIGILTKSQTLRANHHALASEWTTAAESAGLRTAEVISKTVDSSGLRNLMFRLISPNYLRAK